MCETAQDSILYHGTQYMEEHTILPDYLSAYRTGYSTESVLLRLQNDVLKAMDEQNVTALAALDLSAVFDTVDHQVLVHVLNKNLESADMLWIG